MWACDDGLVHVFRMLSTTRAKLCLVVLTRNVQTGSYQLLPDGEMVPNVGKNCIGNFLFVHNNGLAHKAWIFLQFLQNLENKVLPWIAYSPYRNLMKHCWDMLWTSWRSNQVIWQSWRWFLTKNGWIFHKEAIISWRNTCWDQSMLWSQPIEVPHEMDFFCTLHM